MPAKLMAGPNARGARRLALRGGALRQAACVGALALALGCAKPVASSTDPMPATTSALPSLPPSRSPAAAPPTVASGAREARRRYVVAVIGDSLTDPRSHGGLYLELLRQRCPGSRFDNYGVGGQMVNQMRRRLGRELGLEPPDGSEQGDAGAPPEPKPAYDHLLVLGGINDICSDETALRTNDRIEADLRAMYRLAHDRGMRVVALTLPPWGGFERYANARRQGSTLALNAWIQQQKTLGEIDALVDIYPLLSCGEPSRLCKSWAWPDQVHWNAEGHRIVGEALARGVFADCQ